MKNRYAIPLAVLIILILGILSSIVDMEVEEKKEENPVKEQTIEMPKKEADTEAAQQEEKETQKKAERDEDGFILPQKRD